MAAGGNYVQNKNTCCLLSSNKKYNNEALFIMYNRFKIKHCLLCLTEDETEDILE